jgi:hypothetical protein
MQMKFIVIGNIGSDAGYWIWDGHGWKHVGGWGIDQLVEVNSALNIMREAARLKTPGLAQAAAQSVSEFVTKQLGQNVKEGGGVVILG